MPYKYCCPSLITMDDHTDYCLARQHEIATANERIDEAEYAARMAAYERDEALENFARAEQEYVALREALSAARASMPMWKASISIERAKQIIDAALAATNSGEPD